MKKIWKGWLDAETGKFKPDEAHDFTLHSQNLKGKCVDVTMEPHRKKRSTQQLRYRWGVMYKVLSEYFGYTPEEVHEATGMLFRLKHEDGKPSTIRSTGDMTTIEIEEENEKIRMWAQQEFNVYIPLPNEVDFE